MIKWPVLIKHHGNDELTYVASESEWNSNADLSAVDYGSGDALIDNNGRIYKLNNKLQGIVQPIAANDKITLYQCIQLVQRHAALNGECCVEKIVFRSIIEGIDLVASIDENS